MKLIFQPPTPGKEKEIVFEVVSLFGHSLLPCWQLISAVRSWNSIWYNPHQAEAIWTASRRFIFFFFFKFLNFYLVPNHLDILALAKNTPAKRPERRVIGMS